MVLHNWSTLEMEINKRREAVVRRAELARLLSLGRPERRAELLSRRAVARWTGELLVRVSRRFEAGGVALLVWSARQARPRISAE
jgi:hypothetical protein